MFKRSLLTLVVLLPLLIAPCSAVADSDGPYYAYLPWIAGESDMTHGTGSTLTINPKGLTVLTMGLEGSEPYTGSSPYIVPLQTLDLHIERRWQIIYDQQTGGEGGEAVSEFGPLVPVSFWVIIKESTREDMIDAYNDLAQAAMNKKGGTIAYKPENLGAGVLTTYYHYVQSAPPRVVDRPANRWDAAAKSDGYYTLTVEVELQTQPLATSDPDSPETLTDLATTIQNWVDPSEGYTNRVTVQNTAVKGTMPALVRIMARPGSGQYLGRLIMFTRDEGALTTFAAIYEAEQASAIYPSVAWTDISDSDRGEGHYMRCLPATAANGVAQGLRFTITNPDDHKGRFAVFGVGYDAGGVWTHQVKVKVGNIIQTGKDDWEAESVHAWQLIYAGEFELPPVPLSDVETAYAEGPYLDWYSSRASGSSEFRLDAIILVYIAGSTLSPTALDVPCADEDGVTNSEKLLVENFPDDYGIIRELAHVVAQSDEDFKRALALAPRGDFVMLDPTKDTLITFIQEQTGGNTILDDDFSSYKYDRWMPINDMEDDTEWTGGGSNDAVNYCEGDQGIELEIPMPSDTMYTDSIDLSKEGRFSTSDFSVIAVRPKTGDEAAIALYTYFFTSVGNYYKVELANPPAAGWNFITTKKSAFAATGSPDWSSVAPYLQGTTGVAVTRYCTFDHWRLEKADPDDADNPNATGIQWDFQPVGGHWTITEDITSAGATLACLDTETNVEKAALIDETTPNDIQFRARVMAKKTNGYAGIVWRAGDDTLTEGTEDCYVAYIDPANDQMLIGAYANGVYGSSSSPAFTCDADTWYVIGVIAKGTAHLIYAAAASALSDDDDVFSSDYLRGEFTDGTLASGKCGVMSYNTLGRFDETKLVSLRDKMIPSDEITLEGKAIFRTIAPFRE